MGDVHGTWAADGEIVGALWPHICPQSVAWILRDKKILKVQLIPI